MQTCFCFSTVPWGQILLTLSVYTNPPLKWNILILCLFTLQFVDGLPESASFSTEVKSEVVIPLLDLSFAHSIITKRLLNLLDVLSLSINKPLAKLDTLSPLNAFITLSENKNPTSTKYTSAL